MAARIGVRIRNKNNVLVIDDSYYNLMLRQKIVQPSYTYDPRYREYTCSLSISCSQDAVFAYRSKSSFCGITRYITTSSTVRQVILTSYNPIDIDIYIFDKPMFSVLSGNIGLRIRNSVTGEVSFDSRGRYMKILGYLSVVSQPNSGNYDTYNASDKLPAVVPIQPYLYNWASTFDAGGSPVAESGGDNMQILCVGNTVRAKIEEWRYRTGGAGGTFYQQYSGSNVLMFVDVTGY